ncbi:MAG: RNA polymerase sigma factor [Thermoleophilia bacterium]
MTSSPPHHQDARLLRDARRDPDAFRDFYRLHAAWVERWLRQQVGDAGLANDLTAETFAQALLSLHRFRGTEPGSGTSWLFAIARNQVRRAYERRRVASSARARLAMPVRDWVPDETEALDDRLDAEALAGEIAAALGALPEALREALVLRVVDGLDYAEIARATATSEANARMRVSRGLRGLADRLRLVPKEETP